IIYYTGNIDSSKIIFAKDKTHYNIIIPSILNFCSDKNYELIIFSQQDNKINIYTTDNSLQFNQIKSIDIENSFAVSSITSGDFNKDGFDDLLVSKSVTEDEGVLCIYFGKEDIVNFSKDLDISVSGGYFGFSSCNVGDLNGDGYFDFTIGAYTTGEKKQGKVYVYYGAPSINTQHEIALTGRYSPGSFGYCIAPLGDMNGDGFADIIVGAPTSGSERAGQVYIYFGGSPMDTIPDIILDGEHTDDFFGGAIASCYRETGTGNSDFIITAYENDENAESAGKAYVYEGKMPFSSTPVSIWTGENKGDCFGFSCAAGYGVAGEDIWYWIVGAPFNDEGAQDGGKVYLFPSAASAATISGKVLYRETNLGVLNVNFEISGMTAALHADSSGNYISEPLSRTKSYVITPYIAVDIDLSFNSIRMYDAALTAQAAMGRMELSNYQKLSADANNDNRISLYDAAAIAQYAMRSNKVQNTQINEWIFDPVSRSYDPLAQSYSDQNFHGILIGDVNGDWNPQNPLTKPKLFESSEYLKLYVNNEDNLIIDLINITGKELIAAEAEILYDPIILKLQDINLTDLTKNFLSIDLKEEGEAKIGIYSPNPVVGNGSVFSYKFTILDNNIQNTKFEITKYIINDEAPIKIKYDINFDEIVALPKSLELKQNYPNPFNNLTTINFGLPHADEVTITIYNILGEKVKTIFDKQPFNVGYHKVIWNGTNQNGNLVTSGLYFCELLFKKDRKLVKMVYVR
ncbi:FG-GAP repeat protein, partial [candidate division KSB1 bacterium]|nr:FG-GAP repeat protein [candidate division KSB1 bacterium]